MYMMVQGFKGVESRNSFGFALACSLLTHKHFEHGTGDVLVKNDLGMCATDSLMYHNARSHS